MLPLESRWEWVDRESLNSLLMEFRMRASGIGIVVTQPERLTKSGVLASEPFQDVCISGNRSGLLELAEIIRKVALSEQDGYHIHLYPTDEKRLVRTQDFSLTVEKNSLK